MLRKRFAAAALVAAAVLPLGACGGGDTKGGSNDGYQREDPTLNGDNDTDQGNSTESNQTTDNGSGTGSGRGDG